MDGKPRQPTVRANSWLPPRLSSLRVIRNVLQGYVSTKQPDLGAAWQQQVASTAKAGSSGPETVAMVSSASQMLLRSSR